MATEEKDESGYEMDLERLVSPDDLSRALRIVTPNFKWAVIASTLLTLVVVAWLFWGSLPIKVSGTCIVMPHEGLFGVEAEISGTVRELLFKPGQQVAQDQHLLTIGDSQLQIKLTGAQTRLKKLEVSLNELKHQIELETTADKDAIQQEIDAQKFTARQLQSEIDTVSNNLTATRRLFEEGVVSRQQLETETQQLRAKKMAMETTKAKLATLRSKSLRSHRTDEYASMEMQYLAVRDEYNALREKEALGFVRAPASGVVLEGLVSMGDYVTPGDALVWFERTDEDGQSPLVIGFIPVNFGKLIETDSEVLIHFPTFNQQNYGALVGRIQAVSRFAASPENLMKLIKNQSLVNYLVSGQNAVTQLTIWPQPDPDDPTRYRWVGGDGPPSNPTSGFVGTLKTTVKRVAPITYILPDDDL